MLVVGISGEGRGQEGSEAVFLLYRQAQLIIIYSLRDATQSKAATTITFSKHQEIV